VREISWFKVDDGFWSHPKTAVLSDSAVALWVRAGAYSCQHLTDGVIQSAVLRLLGDRAAVDELVTAGLWLVEGDGWRFHDWGEYQETSEAVKLRRADSRERQRRAREVAAKKRRESHGLSHVTDSVTGGVTDGVSSTVSSLYPTRPGPARPDPPSSNEEGEAAAPNSTCGKHSHWDHDQPCRACAGDRERAQQAEKQAEALAARERRRQKQFCEHGIPAHEACERCGVDVWPGRRRA
jgi:hypothetical protein